MHEADDESAGQAPLYVTSGYLQALFEHLRQRNIALGSVLETLGVGEDALTDPDLHVPHENLGPALAVAERLTGDVNIGLHAGQSMQLDQLGIFGYLLLLCRQLDEIFELHVRHQRLVTNASVSSYEDLGDQICFHLDPPPGVPPDTSPHIVEYFISGWMRLARHLLGSDFVPVKLLLQCPKPTEPSDAESIFQCTPLFDQPHLMVYFARDYLERALLLGDATLRQALEAEALRRVRALRDGPPVEAPHADAALAPPLSDDLFLIVRNHVADRLMHGVPEIEEVAHAMGTSVRSLQRLLSRSGTNYKQVLDLVRRELAQRYLHDASLSLTDVALMLGFSDQTAFQRAFRRWFGETPGALRRARKPLVARPTGS